MTLSLFCCFLFLPFSDWFRFSHFCNALIKSFISHSSHFSSVITKSALILGSLFHVGRTNVFDMLASSRVCNASKLLLNSLINIVVALPPYTRDIDNLIHMSSYKSFGSSIFFFQSIPCSLITNFPSREVCKTIS